MPKESSIPWRQSHRCLICGYIKSESTSISYHRLPKNKEKLDKWLGTFDTNADSVKSKLEYARLCSRHFAESDFLKFEVGDKRKLKDDACPSITFIDGDEYFRKKLHLWNRQESRKRKDSENAANSDSALQQKPRTSRTCVICRLQSGLNLSYFSFPKNERRLLWLQACGRNFVTNNEHLCSRHFEKKCFARDPDQSKRSRLKRTAVPTLFLTCFSELTDRNQIKQPSDETVATDVILANDSIRREVDFDDNIDNGSIRPAISEEHNEDTGGKLEDCGNLTPRDITPVPTHYQNTLDHNYCTTLNSSKTKKMLRYIGDVRSPHMRSPRTHMKFMWIAKETIAKQKVKIRQLQRKVRRRDKRLYQLQDAINDLKRKKTRIL